MKEIIKNVCSKCEENIHCQGKGCAWRSLGNEYCDEVEAVDKYITQLETNWNELKKWLEEYIEKISPPHSFNNQNEIFVLSRTLIQMQEIESGRNTNKDYKEKLETLQGTDFCNCLKEYIEYNEKLEQENKQLQEKLEKCVPIKEELETINRKNKRIEELQQENQKLKQQYCERIDCGGRLGNSKKVEELIKENETLKEENKILKEEYDKALEILVDFYPPCERDGFMDKNVEYCSMNCGVDEEVFKECWKRYIKQELEKGTNK